MSAPDSGRRAAVPPTRRGPSRPRVRAVTIVASCLALVAAALVVGVRVYGQEPTVTLLANWTDNDEQNFRDAVIAPFESKYHIHVDYQGSSAESQVLSADVEAGTPPDVVVLTGPGELASYARQQQLQPVNKLIPKGHFSESWTTSFNGSIYWFPLKADLKSIVWYPEGMTESQRQEAAAEPGKWCLGMGSGATSGWPGTDWIEDILLQQSGWKNYELWARGKLPWNSKEVKKAWTTWGSLVGAGNDSDVRRALLTKYQDASALVTKDPPQCALEHQASFIRNESSWKKARGRYEASSRLLGAGSSNAWEVSGDLVALLHATPQAKKLIRYLASEQAQQAWSAREAGFSVDAKVPVTAYGPTGTLRRSLATTLLDKRAVHCFDASDAMPPAVRDAFAQATIDYLARPDDLPSQLTTLDRLSQTKNLTWLPSVCDHAD